MAIWSLHEQRGFILYKLNYIAQCHSLFESKITTQENFLDCFSQGNGLSLHHFICIPASISENQF